MPTPDRAGWNVTHTEPLAPPAAPSRFVVLYAIVGVMSMFAYIVKVEQIVNRLGAADRAETLWAFVRRRYHRQRMGDRCERDWPIRG